MGDWIIETEVRRANVHPGTYQIRGNRPIVLEEGQCFRAINLMSRGTEESPGLVATDYTELWTESLIEHYANVG
jgi:hypothetical protein